MTGIAKPVGGPYDTAIFIDMKDVWEAHGEKDEAHREVTALLVVPKGYKEAMALLASYQKNRDVQMVFPSQSIISLYAMVGQTNFPYLPPGRIPCDYPPCHVLERFVPYE